MTNLPIAELHPGFVQALREEREALNSRVAARRLAGVPFQPDVLLVHLQTAVDPIVRAVHAIFPERVRSVVVALFEASLDLLGASLLGPQAKLPHVNRTWHELLPTVPRLLALEPLRVAGCLSNAAAFVGSQKGTQPEAWLARMVALAPDCESVAQLLDGGKIAAWQAGLVQIRGAALRTALTLSPPVAARALGLPPETPTEVLSTAVQRLQGNPWLTVKGALRCPSAHPPLQAVGVAGAFRGFGGEFLRPPTVTLHQGQLLVSDGQFSWRLLADTYGTWLHRSSDPPKRPKGERRDEQVSVANNGDVSWGGVSARFAQLAGTTSFASDGTTLAITTATSHHVFLIGRRDGLL